MIPSIETIDLLQLACGNYLSISVYKFIGKQTGKKAYIQANLHGAEIVGNTVIYQLIDFLSQLKENQLIGEIWLLPLCNPLSVNQRNHFFSTGRFNSYDGKDWNRIFWDYQKECHDLKSFALSQTKLSPEQIRNNFLQKEKLALEKQLEQINSPSSTPFHQKYRYHLQSLAIDANYVIDIHSSSNEALEYLYCFNTREESAKYFGLEYGILMNQYDGDAFDEAFMKPWLALEKELDILGKKIQFDIESWTLELGASMESNPSSVAKGLQGIKNYLVYKNMLNIPSFNLEAKPIQLIRKTNLKKYYAPAGGILKNRLSLGTKVQSGSQIYQIMSFEKTQMPKTISIQAQTNGIIFDVGKNEAVNQGEYVLEILTLEN